MKDKKIIMRLLLVKLQQSTLNGDKEMSKAIITEMMSICDDK